MHVTHNKLKVPLKRKKKYTLWKENTIASLLHSKSEKGNRNTLQMITKKKKLSVVEEATYD